MKKIYYNWSDINGHCAKLVRDISLSNWKPDYVIGLTRGGLLPAVMLSHYFKVPMHTLDLSLRDNIHVPDFPEWIIDEAANRNILIIDDINDTGATINYIITRFQAMSQDLNWNNIWHSTVKFAVLVDNLDSNVKVDFSACEINKSDSDCWIIYPWEEWWQT